MKIVCAWCGKVIKNVLSKDETEESLVSHGICPVCKELHFGRYK